MIMSLVASLVAFCYCCYVITIFPIMENKLKIDGNDDDIVSTDIKTTY